MKLKKAICLLSGGLDSATCVYDARHKGFEVIGLTIDYGQRHDRELASAADFARLLKIQHYNVAFDMPWRGSSLTDKSVLLHDAKDVQHISKRIPNTYVPARNSIFLSLAASCAEASGAEAIFIGANAVDYSGYPDCRPLYLKAFEDLIKKGTKAGAEGRKLKIYAPLLRLSKKQIVLKALKLGVPIEKTWSCYRGGKNPCGSCDSCLLREKGFKDAGKKDPLLK
jgi:7-cyano-7-deazaguanine synthase